MFVCVLLQCQAVQDVAKAVSLFESTGRIPATVMEARYSVRLHIIAVGQFAISIKKIHKASSYLCLQYLQETLFLDTIPPSSTHTKSGENIHRVDIFCLIYFLCMKIIHSLQITCINSCSPFL